MFHDILVDKALPKTSRPEPTAEYLATLYPTVHPDDRRVVHVIDPRPDTGPWIAGGAPLRWYLNQPVDRNDIDVFCANKHQADAVIQRLVHNRAYLMVSTPNAKTYQMIMSDHTNTRTVQVITCKFFPNMQAVLDQFDITVCQVGTCGREWQLGQDTARHIHTNQLVFNYIQPDSIKRLIKYQAYGYRPSIDTMTRVIDAPRDWKFESMDYDDFDFNPPTPETP